MLKKTSATLAVTTVLFIQGCGSNEQATNAAHSDPSAASPSSTEVGQPAPLVSASPLVEADPILGRCHMDECTWYRPIKKYKIPRSIMYNGERVKIDMVAEEIISGYSGHRDGNYPSYFNKSIAIKWSNKNQKTFYICDKDFSAAIFKSNASRDVKENYLTFINPYDPYGYDVDLIQGFLRVCFNKNFSTDEIFERGINYKTFLKNSGMFGSHSEQIRATSIDNALYLYVASIQNMTL